jgi:hypothetical protein
MEIFRIKIRQSLLGDPVSQNVKAIAFAYRFAEGRSPASIAFGEHAMFESLRVTT